LLLKDIDQKTPMPVADEQKQQPATHEVRMDLGTFGNDNKNEDRATSDIASPKKTVFLYKR
jgi:hypothetical protein